MEKPAGCFDLSSMAVSRKRELSEISFSGGGRILHGGKEYVNFSSNDYLGLSSHPEILAAVRDGLLTNVGTASSRLMTGSTRLHHLLEEKVARFKNKPAALIFNTGYQANTGVISSLVGKGDCVFSDKLSHASIVDGIKLSGAVSFRFRHNDTENLEELLRKNRRNFRKALIVTESLFSMDGDEAPLKEITALKRSYGCLLMIDEAHATGIFGSSGAGLSEETGLSEDIDVIMGTFSKALGVFGAYVAVDNDIKEYLINRCRSFIYSTSLPVPVVAGCLKAIDVASLEEWRRRELLEKAAYFRKNLGLKGLSGRSQIVPVVVGDDSRVLSLADGLKKRGWWVLAVRPPTVPPKGARLRLSVTMHHDIKVLDDFTEDLSYCLKKET